MQNRKTWTVEMRMGDKSPSYLVTRDYKQIDHAVFSGLGLCTFYMAKQTASNWAKMLNRIRSKDDVRRKIVFAAVKPLPGGTT